ncbi:LPXTG cell wall anchor domain-containing protein [Enterococcus quebecensis]|uniref:Gram-positive cocci surface proteins LPxTG domain-containing protein n=1 Tax=Enterococcus quebecensis TaxID=903983 RepID=A0A1E5GQX2_9ENTE|nr:LPXTG cell wall anchor domain-containing protein [Enterococcus quebecensis]OEG15103.1 hypothetical protein BCR23_09690 [Enterococcus quebecensis]OJG71464.1 hypothetical protein RV12_GL001538 [Enterococcus quebecensis]
MKKIVFCLVVLSLTLPSTSLAQESLPTSIGSPSDDNSMMLTNNKMILGKEKGTRQKVTLAMSSPVNNQKQRRIALLNTGEQKTVYLSIAGIAIILLAILFLFIKSKKNR